MPSLPELDARGRRLGAALAAVLIRDNAPELRLVRAWLNNWSGLGRLRDHLLEDFQVLRSFHPLSAAWCREPERDQLRSGGGTSILACDYPITPMPVENVTRGRAARQTPPAMVSLQQRQKLLAAPAGMSAPGLQDGRD